MTANDKETIRCLGIMCSFIQLIASLLDAVREHKVITGLPVRLDLSQVSGMIMYFTVEITKLTRHCGYI